MCSNPKVDRAAQGAGIYAPQSEQAQAAATRGSAPKAAQGQEAKDDYTRRLRRRGGATVLTSARGVEEGARVGKKTILGG